MNEDVQKVRCLRRT